METRYYSDIKQAGGERKLALHASKTVFDRIKRHRERKELLRAEMEKEAMYKQYLRDGTKAMTEKWENSVEFIRKKKEEDRQQKITEKADDRVERYYKVLQLQAEERKQYNEDVKRKRFITRGAQKTINSAVLCSNCHFENRKQVELNNKEKNRIQADWEQYEQKILEEDETFKKEELMKECKKRQNAEENKIILLRQIEEKRKQKEDEARIRLENDNVDITKQMEEMNIIKKNAEEDFINAKKYCLNALKVSRDIKKKEDQAHAKREKEIEIVAQIFRDTKTKIQCKKEKKRKEEIEKTQERQLAACKVLSDINSQKRDTEKQLIANAVAEQEEAEALKLQKKRDYEEQLIKDRKKNYEDALFEKQRKHDEEHEIAKWEMLNRMKIKEVREAEEMEMQERKQNKIASYCAVLDEQVEDRRKRLAEKKAEEDSFIWNNYPEVDQNFLTYADEMLVKQKTAGKPTYPVERTIMEYKEHNGLVLRNKQKQVDCFHGKNDTKKKRPSNTRRICPTKNDSSNMRDCFCR